MIYRKFDSKSRGKCTFSDFAFVLEDLGLLLERELVIAMFAYLDRDQDNVLNFDDFVFLCQ